MPSRLASLALSVLIPALLSACGFGFGGGDPAAEQQRLAFYCETKKCSCQQATSSLLGSPPKEPVLWHADGTAYCRDGWLLTRPD